MLHVHDRCQEATLIRSHVVTLETQRLSFSEAATSVDL